MYCYMFVSSRLAQYIATGGPVNITRDLNNEVLDDLFDSVLPAWKKYIDGGMLMPDDFAL